MRPVFADPKTDFVMQLRTSEHYPDLEDVVGVTICDFELWPEDGEETAVPMLSRWRMQEQHAGSRRGLGQVQYVFLELPKYAAGKGVKMSEQDARGALSLAIARGHARGHEEGRAAERADLLQSLAEQKFGPLSPVEVARLRAGKPQELADRMGRLLQVETLEEIFEG